MSNLIIVRSYYHESKKYTPEEYIRFRILDSPSHIKFTRIFADKAGITKDQLKELAIEKYRINGIKSKTTKEEILNKILENENIYTLAEMFNIGVKWFQYAESFGLSKNQVLKLEKKSFLKIIDYEYNNSMQKECVYDIKQFADMTKEIIDKVIEKYKFYKEDGDIFIDDINNAFERNKEWYKFMNDLDEQFKDVEEFAEDPYGFMEKIKWNGFNNSKNAL